MTKDEHKSAIVQQLQQQSLNLLVDSLAAALDAVAFVDVAEHVHARPDSLERERERLAADAAAVGDAAARAASGGLPLAVRRH